MGEKLLRRVRDFELFKDGFHIVRDFVFQLLGQALAGRDLSGFDTEDDDIVGTFAQGLREPEGIEQIALVQGIACFDFFR